MKLYPGTKTNRNICIHADLYNESLVHGLTIHGSKFYPRSLTLVIPILKMVNDGKIAAQIGRTLNLSKPHVSYYIHKSKDLGYVNESIRDAITVLELTQAGKNFLDQYEKHHQTIPTCRAENIRFKAEVLQMPSIPVDWNRIQMHNWTQYTAVVDNIHVRLNLGKTPSIELIPSPLDGEDYNELIVTLVYDCIGTIRSLEGRFGIRVGRLQLSSRGEWIVYDPIAKAYSKHIGQVEYEGVGKVNASASSTILQPW